VSARRIILFGVLGLTGLALLAISLCPKPSLYGDTTFSKGVMDRDGRLLRLALAGDERYRLRSTLEQISPVAIEATLLYEDRHFDRHPGFNPGSLVRAFWSTYVRGDRPMGASTITMQLARMRFELDTRSVAGKLIQIARAIQLEWHYDKDEILEAYLNLAPYGGNIEGIATAGDTRRWPRHGRGCWTRGQTSIRCKKKCGLISTFHSTSGRLLACRSGHRISHSRSWRRRQIGKASS
jgi:penicillin-binding protein 1C